MSLISASCMPCPDHFWRGLLETSLLCQVEEPRGESSIFVRLGRKASLQIIYLTHRSHVLRHAVVHACLLLEAAVLWAESRERIGAVSSWPWIITSIHISYLDVLTSLCPVIHPSILTQVWPLDQQPWGPQAPHDLLEAIRTDLEAEPTPIPFGPDGYVWMHDEVSVLFLRGYRPVHHSCHLTSLTDPVPSSMP